MVYGLLMVKFFDVGRQTLQALTEYARGTSPRYSGLCIPEGKGNGALMRTLALALLKREVMNS